VDRTAGREIGLVRRIVAGVGASLGEGPRAARHVAARHIESADIVVPGDEENIQRHADAPPHPVVGARGASPGALALLARFALALLAGLAVLPGGLPRRRALPAGARSARAL